ncbi:hypothetical protein Pan181_50390 [Aeoliella mucimassa]|uniref:Uncharacterized protein n=1 Tax=Aeoliella mucimassa TaxID=2527972 RepID=A0A518AVN6_9BACT|nr:hypothetical protein Pan181_50390 [Aeoliella mucimassa]
MQLSTNKRLAIDSHRKNRFPLDAFWEMGIYSGAKTTGFVARAEIQFSHRWVNWESICPAVGIYSWWWESIWCRMGSWRKSTEWRAAHPQTQWKDAKCLLMFHSSS